MTGGKQSSAPVRVRHYSPKEFAAELKAAGLPMCERTVRDRCNLPAASADHIATNPLFKGRHLIPETEIFRLMRLEVTA